MKWLAMSFCTAFGAAAMGQTIYRCDGPQGPVFSQLPCATDPAKVKTIRVKPIGHADPEAIARLHDLEASDDARRHVAEMDAFEQNCISGTADATVRDSNERIAAMGRQISALYSEIGLANNNLAGATYASGLRNQIASLNESIARERATMQDAITSARNSCHAARLVHQSDEP